MTEPLSDLSKRVAFGIEGARHKPGERASIAQANAAIDNVAAWLLDHAGPDGAHGSRPALRTAAEHIAEERERVN